MKEPDWFLQSGWVFVSPGDVARAVCWQGWVQSLETQSQRHRLVSRGVVGGAAHLSWVTCLGNRTYLPLLLIPSLSVCVQGAGLDVGRGM